MEGVKVSKRPRLKNPILIVAWPGMGEVAFKAANYLVEELHAEEFAQILPEDFFYLTGSAIQKGILSLPQLPSSKFYFWKNKAGKNDLIIFLSNAQPDLLKAESYCQRILSVAKFYRVRNIVGFAAMPQPMDHTQSPRAFAAATNLQLLEHLKKIGLNAMNEGSISGMNGLFLGLAKKEGLDGFCLLGEIPIYTVQIENPKASQAVLEALVKVLELKLDFSGLVKYSQNIEGEVSKLLDYLKIGTGSQGPGPIGEDDIEKIKKSLSQLTKLPFSAKVKIEKLFTEAQSDINKAHQLKAELDTWNVYNDFEDRFLDLFKKAQDKGN